MENKHSDNQLDIPDSIQPNVESVFSGARPAKQPFSLAAKIVYTAMGIYLFFGGLLFILSLGMGAAGFAPLFLAAGSIYILIFLSLPAALIALNHILKAYKNNQSQRPLNWVTAITGLVTLLAITYGVLAENIIKPREAAAFCEQKIASGEYVPRYKIKDFPGATYQGTDCEGYIRILQRQN